MAYKIRPISRKQQLQKPDEFVSTIDRLAELGRKHTRQFLIAAVSVLLIAAAAGGTVWFRLYQEERASELELQAAGYYHQPVVPDKKEGEAETPSREENLKKAIELYKKVVSDYPGTESAGLSQYYLGNSYLESGDYAGAISAYDLFIKKRSRSAAMTALAYQRLGHAHLAAGDPDSALHYFESILTMPGVQNKDQALFEIAKLQEDRGRKESAVQTYQTIVKEYPDSILATESTVRLKALGVTKPASVFKENPPDIPQAPPVKKPNAGTSQK